MIYDNIQIVILVVSVLSSNTWFDMTMCQVIAHILKATLIDWLKDMRYSTSTHYICTSLIHRRNLHCICCDMSSHNIWSNISYSDPNVVNW